MITEEKSGEVAGMEITEALLELAAKNARRTVNVKELGKETLLIEDLGYDSVDLMELIIQIEDKYGVAFADSNVLLHEMDRIGTIIEFVEQKLQEREDG